jgi:site-specific recombinase XerD
VGPLSFSETDEILSLVAPEELRVEHRQGRWELAGPGAEQFGLLASYLGYLTDRAYSPRTVEAYAFDLLAFARWLRSEDLTLEPVTADVIIRYLAACRRAPVRGRPGGNVYSIRDGRSAGYAVATINRRLAAISGFFGYREMLDPDARNPVPRGREARRVARGERSGDLGHLAKPRARSRLRLREPRRLPRALEGDELRALIGSFRTQRDRAIARLMVFSGLRSAEVLGLQVRDIDIGRGWARVVGKGNKSGGSRSTPTSPRSSIPTS